MGKSTIILSAEDQTKAAFDSVKKGLSQIESSVDKVKGVFSGFAAIAATVGITDLMKEAVAAASVSEQSSNRLNAVIKATGDTSGYTREQLDKMADSLSKATTFDDEGIREAQSNLMKFGKLHGDTFSHALKLSADYAAFTGGSMVEATQAIGKALADPVNGVTALEKAFGHLSQTQKDNIEKFVSQGNIASAQAIIFKKLEDSIGGTAGAMNTGLFGATSAATKAWDDFLKAIGKTGPVQVTTTGGLNLITEGLNLVTEAIKNQNKELAKNPLYNGGTLQPLPQQPQVDPWKALQGSKLTIGDMKNLPPGLRPSMVPPEQNNMTVDDAKAMGAAARKSTEEAQLAAAEAHKKLMKEMIPLADELAHAYAAAATKQKDAAQEILHSYFDDQIKQKLEFEKMADELGKSQSAADISQKQAAAEILYTFQQEENARLGILNDQQKQEKLIQIMDGMRTAREIEDQDWIEKQQILQERYQTDYDNRVYWQKKLLLLDQDHTKKAYAADVTDYKKKHELDVAFKKLDLDSAAFFFNEMSAMMSSKNRSMFEIGKVAAISDTIVRTWSSAQKSYDALAGIPIIGPALGAAAAGAAIVAGIARVQAIKSTNFGGGVGGGAVGTFSANPVTGVPDSPSPAFEQVTPVQQSQAVQRKDVFIQILGEGMFSAAAIRDQLIPLLNDAVGDGVQLHASVV